MSNLEVRTGARSWTVRAVSGAAGGFSHKATVALTIDCDADTVESVRKLVAAAPELLDALKWVVECSDPTIERDGDEYFDYADLYHAVDRARAAIAKATGN
jgi:hypothetical protein